MKWSSDERQQFVSSLDAVDRVVVTFYRLLLGLIIAAVVAVVFLVVRWRPWGDGNQGEWFYFSIAVLFALGWVMNQYVMLARRQRNRTTRSPLRSSVSSTEDGARTWEFQIGPTAEKLQQSPQANVAQFGLSKGFEIPLATLPASVLPNKEALACLAAELDRGADIDEACRIVEPAFAGWNRREQEAYLLCIKKLLNQQRSPDSTVEQDPPTRLDSI